MIFDIYAFAARVSEAAGMHPDPTRATVRRSVASQISGGRVTFSFPTLGNILHLTQGADGQVFMWTDRADPDDTIRATPEVALDYAVGILTTILRAAHASGRIQGGSP